MATALFNDSSFARLLPLLFLGVIVFVAIRFGSVAGILGTLAAGLIFAIFLFQPTPSPFVEDPISRNHLVWMLLIGVVVSELLRTYSVPGSHKKH
jgi:K+-sensing histidine kinase KdpD